MSPSDRDQPERIAARVAELELLFTHLQRMVEELNGVILTQQRRLDAMELQLDRATRSMQSLEGIAQQRPEEENPPHY